MNKNQKLLLLAAIGIGAYMYQQKQTNDDEEITLEYDISDLGVLEQKYYIQYVQQGFTEDELWTIISAGNVILKPTFGGGIQYVSTAETPYIDVTRG